MFTSLATSLLSLSLLAAQVKADVTPTEPGPNAAPFTQGQDCTFAWNGDTNVTTKAFWTSFNVQLMSGSNWAMKHVTTVAQGQDGTVNGQFKYPCPPVTPNSDIYFYQFSSPLTKTLMWTTRFTIASPSGATTPPANSVQPDGQKIGWGDGALVDPSTAVPPPSYLAAGAPAGTSGAAGATTAGQTTAATAGNTLAASPSVPVSSPSAHPSTSPSANVSTSAPPSQPTNNAQGVAVKGFSVLTVCMVALAFLV